MTQDDALTILKMGHNVYLTGAAGTGKTYVLNKYIQYLKEKSINTGITASTGIAATHINGMTIHSWSGLGIRDSLSGSDISSLMDKLHLLTRFLYTKVLIIDEVSMLHGYRLDMVDRLLRAFKYTDRPFGGLQVILCGDFFQLPPVTRGNENGSFAYQAEVWEQMNLKVCYLTHQYRQSEDGILSVLNDIRKGDTGEHTLELLRKRYQKEIEGITVPTKLYTHNADVDTINYAQLAQIDSPAHSYDVRTTGKRELCEVLKKSCLAPEHLTLKKGATVMFVKNNYDEGYVNGTVGEIVDFEKGTDYPIVKLKDGREVIASPEAWVIEDEGVKKAEINQIPLRLAWAITIHKSQGMSLDAAEIDLSKSFIPGMGYVALSRVRTLDGMKLVGFNKMALEVNQAVLDLDRDFIRLSEENEDELVQASSVDKEEKQKHFAKVSSSKYTKSFL